MKWKQLFNYSVYRKMLIYFILLVALAVLAVSSTLYFFFASKTEETISKNVISMLQQTSYTSSIVHEQIETIGNHLLSNNRIITVLMNKEHDYVQDRDAMDILLDIQSTYPFIKYIGIYNDHTKRYLNTAGTTYVLNDLEKERITDINQIQYMELFANQLRMPNAPSTSKPEHVLTAILRPNYALTSAYKGAITIHVDEQYILNTIKAISSANDDVFVMNADGLILSHTDANQFMQSFASMPHIERILNSSMNAGHFKAKVNGSKQLVTYVKSSQLNWYFVSVKPYRLLISDISVLRTFTGLIAMVIIALGALTAFFATNKLYNPLGRLIKKVHEVTGNKKPLAEQNQNEFALLSEAFSNVIDQANMVELEQKQSLPVLKKTYLQHLLHGTLHDLSATHMIQSAINEYFNSSNYVVIVAQIDRFAEFEQHNNQTKQGLFRFSVSNITNELLQKHAKNETIVVDEQTLAILLFLDSPSVPEHILLTLSEIQEVIYKYFKFTVTFSLGETVNDKYEIDRSFESAQEYAKYRFFYGHQAIIHEAMVVKVMQQANVYPAAAEKKLCEELRLNHNDKVNQALDQFMKQLGDMSYYQAISSANQLLNALLRDFDGALPIMQEYSKEYYDTVNQLQKQETLQEVHSLLRHFCTLIGLMMDKRQTTKTDTLIESVCAYLQKHYHESDLGIETIAETVQLSPGYLGKLFRSHTQLSFNDYLKKIRLEEATRLLTTTNDSIAAISENVGVLNTTYFFTLFKKTHGISPAQYREQHSK